jgi:ribose transport system substrate-binding protein
MLQRLRVAFAITALVVSTSVVVAGVSGASSVGRGVAKAKALLVAAEKPVTKFVAPGPAFNASAAKGKSLFYIDYSSSPAVDEWASVATTVLQSYGVNVTHINGDASTANFNQAIQEAITQNASAIMLMGIDPASVAEEVAAAKSANIPVLLGSSEQVGYPSYPGVVASATINGVEVGSILADWMVARSNGKVDADIITHDGVLGTAQEVSGIRDQLKALCPKTCKAKAVNLPFAQISGETQLAEGLITRDPKLNFVVPVYDFELASIQPAVVAAGASKRVQLGSFNALANILTLMASGGPITADVGSPNGWFGYAIADQVMRVLTSTKPVANEESPLRLFVPSNIKGLDLSATSDSGWYGSINFEADYANLWGSPAS